MQNQMPTPETFGEVNAQVEGFLNKTLLVSKYALMTLRDLGAEAAANAHAVWYADDPATYQAEKEMRRQERVARLGEWVVERQTSDAASKY